MNGFAAFQDPKYDAFEYEGNAAKIAIFIHGFPGTPYEMRLVANIFNELGFTTRGLLLPGFGKNIDKLATKRKEDWLSYVRDQIHDAHAAYEEVWVVGYSFGGALSINVIAEDKRTNPHRIVLIAPFWNIFAQYPWIVRVTGPFVWPLGRLFSPEIKVYDNIDFDNPSHREDLEEIFPNIDLSQPEVQNFIKNITIPFELLDEIYKIGKAAKRGIKSIQETPILVIQGLNDSIVTPRSTQQLVKHNHNIVYRELAKMTHDFIRPEKNHKGIIKPLITEFVEL